MKQIEQYRVLEAEVPSGTSATFEMDGQKETVTSFAVGNRHLIRWMPMHTGRWHSTLRAGDWCQTEEVMCIPAQPGNHGPVQVKDMAFVYADGTPYQPFGTTCYAWNHQPEDVQQKTLATLRQSPFNKLRMCVFPKHMIYSENEPEIFPFQRRDDGSWDVSRPVEAFWHRLDQQILALDALEIEADLILFHPYDRWGFATMNQEDSLAYLDYCVRRLGAFKNVWWSLANEFDLLLNKSEADWEAFAAHLLQGDAKHHLRSIHHCCAPYPSRSWMTHVSTQTSMPRKALALRWQYQLPVIVDEFGYEGDIEFTWGNLTAREFVHRAWTAVCSGGWPTHGETLLNENEHLWWAKGGELQGEAPERIRFLKELMSELPGTPAPLIQPLAYDVNGTKMDEANVSPFIAAMMRFNDADRIAYMLEITPTAISGANWQIHYMGRGQSKRCIIQLPEEETWMAWCIDTWNMERELIESGLHGNVRLELGGEGMAVLLTKEEESI